VQTRGAINWGIGTLNNQISRGNIVKQAKSLPINEKENK